MRSTARLKSREYWVRKLAGGPVKVLQSLGQAVDVLVGVGEDGRTGPAGIYFHGGQFRAAAVAQHVEQFAAIGRVVHAEAGAHDGVVIGLEGSADARREIGRGTGEMTPVL